MWNDVAISVDLIGVGTIPQVKQPSGIAALGKALNPDPQWFGGYCWLLLWVGINTGPGNIDLNIIESSWSGFFNGVRATFPLAVLTIWIFHILIRKQATIRSFTWPEALWIYYGIVSLIAGLYADPWFEYAYWGFAYLSAFAATEIYMRGSVATDSASALNHLNWVMGAAVLVIEIGGARPIARRNTGRLERLWGHCADADRRRDGDGAGIRHITARGGTLDRGIRISLEDPWIRPRHVGRGIRGDGVLGLGNAVARFTLLICLGAELCNALSGWDAAAREPRAGFDPCHVAFVWLLSPKQPSTIYSSTPPGKAGKGARVDVRAALYFPRRLATD